MMLKDLGKVPSDISASKELNRSWNTAAVFRRLKNDIFGEVGKKMEERIVPHAATVQGQGGGSVAPTFEGHNLQAIKPHLKAVFLFIAYKVKH